MPHRFLAIITEGHVEQMRVMIGAILATLTSIPVLFVDSGVGVEVSANEEVRLLIMPLLGAMVATVGAYLLSPSEEPRKLAGRSVYSMGIGTAAPVGLGFMTSYGQEMSKHPVSLFLAGIGGATVVFILIRPLIDRLHKNSKPLADAAISMASKAVHLPQPEDQPKQS